MSETLIPALSHLAKALRRKSREFATVVKSGRTHLMDATPVTLGQEFGGYAAAIEYRHRASGGRAAPGRRAAPRAARRSGPGSTLPRALPGVLSSGCRPRPDLPLREARNHFEAQGARDALVEASGVCKTIAVSLYKCATDLRWMGSGPRTGLAEIRIPDLQPGSSIMPGKVNPVIPEAVSQVVAQVIGNDAAVAFGGAAGNFELNVMLPVIARNLLESIRLLAAVSTRLRRQMHRRHRGRRRAVPNYALSSPAIGTSLNPYIGYEEAAKVIKASMAEGKDLRTVVLERDLLTEEEVDRALDVVAMTKGGIISQAERPAVGRSPAASRKRLAANGTMSPFSRLSIAGRAGVGPARPAGRPIGRPLRPARPGRRPGCPAPLRSGPRGPGAGGHQPGFGQCARCLTTAWRVTGVVWANSVAVRGPARTAGPARCAGWGRPARRTRRRRAGWPRSGS